MVLKKTQNPYRILIFFLIYSAVLILPAKAEAQNCPDTNSITAAYCDSVLPGCFWENQRNLYLNRTGYHVCKGFISNECRPWGFKSNDNYYCHLDGIWRKTKPTNSTPTPIPNQTPNTPVPVQPCQPGQCGRHANCENNGGICTGTFPNCTCELPPKEKVKEVYDIGYNISCPHGNFWSFPNYSSCLKIKHVCQQVFFTNTNTAGLNKFCDFFHLNELSGHCYGFSATNTLYYNTIKQPLAQYSKDSNNLFNSFYKWTVKEELGKWQILQISPDLNLTKHEKAQDFIEGVKNQLITYKKPVMIILLDKDSGHAVNVYKIIKQQNETFTRFYVADSIVPCEENLLFLGDDGIWQYPNLVWSGSMNRISYLETPKILSKELQKANFPDNITLINSRCTNLGADNFKNNSNIFLLPIAFSLNTYQLPLENIFETTLVTESKAVGFLNGKFVRDPDDEIMVPLEMEGMIYVPQRDFEYSLQIRGKAKNNLNITQFRKRNFASLDVPIERYTKDELNMPPGGKEVSYKSNEYKNIDLTYYIEGSTIDTKFNFQNIRTSAKKPILLKAYPDAQKVSYQSPQDDNYKLTISNYDKSGTLLNNYFMQVLSIKKEEEQSFEVNSTNGKDLKRIDKKPEEAVNYITYVDPETGLVYFLKPNESVLFGEIYAKEDNTPIVFPTTSKTYLFSNAFAQNNFLNRNYLEANISIIGAESYKFKSSLTGRFQQKVSKIGSYNVLIQKPGYVEFSIDWNAEGGKFYKGVFELNKGVSNKPITGNNIITELANPFKPYEEYPSSYDIQKTDTLWGKLGKEKPLEQFMSFLLTWIYTISGTLGALKLSLSGYQIITAKGNKKIVIKAKKDLQVAILAIFLIFTSYLILNFTFSNLNITWWVY